MAKWNENNTPIGTLKRAQEQFLEARGWTKNHTPKNLAMSIAIEAAELMEIFQWVDADKAMEKAHDPETFNHIQEEVADVVIYCLSLARVLDFDMATAVQQKIAKNNKRFPEPTKQRKDE